MIDPAHHNELLKACRKPSTLMTWLRVALGWLAVIALAAMACESLISAA